MYDYLIVGAGFSGVVLAERLANGAKKKVCIIDKRNHIAGNAYDYYNNDNILVHKFGPHWFHTNNDEVFNYLSNFTEWIEHQHIIKSKVNGKLYDFPINKNTINSFFNVSLTKEEEVKDFIDSKKEFIKNPKNAEEMVLSLLGKELYESFYLNYTIKQWNIHPKELAPSITARIPIRFNNNNSYFNDKYQVMPKIGYTKLFERMLYNKNITLLLNTDFKETFGTIKYNKLIYTGAIDEFFDNCFGELPYRSLKFEHETIDKEYFQECQQINFPNDYSYTRIVEWKHATGQKLNKTSILKEYPVEYQKGLEKFYPIPMAESNERLNKYLVKAKQINNVIFCGRLAEYKYYNMDQVIARSLKLFKDLTSK
ncbi:MAG: UDP-galactopyranose mutase [Bacteroidetes bacterium]|nr:UDP-galactopyranose mutase [Bacteroidota bacterium]